jgi:hypothetical protein
MTDKEQKEPHVIFYILLALCASIDITIFCIIIKNMWG